MKTELSERLTVKLKDLSCNDMFVTDKGEACFVPFVTNNKLDEFIEQIENKANNGIKLVVNMTKNEVQFMNVATTVRRVNLKVSEDSE